MASIDPVRVAAVGDLHCSRESSGALRRLFEQAAAAADVLALCGDLTDYGRPEEAELLAGELAAAAARIPVVAVLGNHDHESGKAPELKEALTRAGVRVLDGEACEILGVGFAGVKGYVGGFGRRSLQAWGEPTLKAVVHETAEEVIKLERALARLRSSRRVVLLHYAPIQATVEGEPPEIFPFLGSSHLEEPINRYEVDLVFHGHAHHGRPEGRTSAGVPVYNCAMSLMRRTNPDQAPFRLVSLPAKVPA